MRRIKQKWIFVFVILVFSMEGWTFPKTPNPDQTGGSLCTTQDHDFEEFRYEEQIPYCRRNVSTDEKNQIYRDYGIPIRCKHNYTIDHFIPLSIGGDNTTQNLWPEHRSLKETRPDLEWEVYLALKNGNINQEEAVDIIYEEKMNPDILIKRQMLLDECIHKAM